MVYLSPFLEHQSGKIVYLKPQNLSFLFVHKPSISLFPGLNFIPRKLSEVPDSFLKFLGAKRLVHQRSGTVCGIDTQLCKKNPKILRTCFAAFCDIFLNLKSEDRLKNVASLIFFC